MKIYVASSWRNLYQPEVVRMLRAMGHEVYDFKDSDGFSWREISPHFQRWTPQEFVAGLDHSAAQRGYTRDWEALAQCDMCIMVMPCGMSASLEFGYAIGADRMTIVYIPEMREPELMIKMAGAIALTYGELRSLVETYELHVHLPRMQAL